MKISWIADCHLNKVSYRDDQESFMFTSLPFRSRDFMLSFEYMVNYNIEVIKPDLIVILGDIYDTFDPNNIVMGFFNEQVKKISDAKIPLIILVGNHDICSKHHALLPLMKLGLKNIKIIEQPQTLLFKDILLLLFPYSVDIERKIVTPKNQFKEFMQNIKTKIAENKELQDKKIMFAGHFGVNGAFKNKYVAENDSIKVVLNNSDDDISIEDLEYIGAEYIFLGDYHKHQILNTKKCIAMYPGSIERTDMSEAEDKKGFILYDTDSDIDIRYGKCRFIEYPNIRPMVDISGNLSEINDFISNLDNNYKNAIVRISVKGDKKEIMAFDTMQYYVYKTLKEKIDPIYIKKRNIIIDNETKSSAEKIEKQISLVGDIAATEVIDVVKESILEIEKDKDEIKILNDLAEDIYKVVKMKNEHSIK